MKISEIHSAMGLKFNLSCDNASRVFKEGALIKIEPAQENKAFLCKQYGEGIAETHAVLCTATAETSGYLIELFDGEKCKAHRCMYIATGIYDDYIEVQAYSFRSVTEINTAIDIIVSDKILQKRSAVQLKDEFLWTQLGLPALFCLNYKSRKKQKDSLGFAGGKRNIIAQITSKGTIVAESIGYQRKKYDVPIDIIIAPEINFIPQEKQTNANEKLGETLDTISSSASYFERWDAYDALSKKLIQNESEEFGEILYTAFSFSSIPSGTEFEFEVQETVDESFIGKEIGASVRDDKLKDGKIEKKREIAVGQIKKIVGNKVITQLGSDENINMIPANGILTLYTAGDNYIMARRMAARKRMLQYRAPIKSIVSLIETGATGYELPSAWGKNIGVTDKLKRNFKGAQDLNPEQIKALEMAINTPDIALVQGPPGTGKTTVIKAICERFREIYEANEKQLQQVNDEYILKSPKILISSFQNEAVDNAISTPLPGDIPAYRKTAKRVKDSSVEQYQKSLNQWYEGLCNSINNMIEDSTAAKYLEEKRSLDDQFLSYKNSGEQLGKATELISRYLGYIEIDYPSELIESARGIISASNNSETDGSVDAFVEKLESQRLTPQSFSDDGMRNARKLRAYLSINDEMHISDNVKNVIERVCVEDYSEDDFNDYIKAIEELKKEHCKKEAVDSKDKEAVNECILSLANTFSRHYLDTLSSLESKKSLILSSFLSRLEQDYEPIVKKYSMTTAATCQTSLDLRDDPERTYDLVIVDEAARANPLDLFIPMSMGRKVILVGDHKQLPHMLEPDVLKLLSEDSRFKDIPEIEKSLFERLFGMFEKAQFPKAVRLTRQYRMHPEICSFVSEAFYDGVLKTAAEITSEMRKSPVEINEGKPLAFVNISIAKGPETSGVSKSRWAEAEIIGEDIRKIINIEPDARVGVITFYSKQVQIINDLLDKLLNDEEKAKVEVGTVDAFQGKEFDYVLLSCVRSNSPKGNEKPVVGFLEKPNRLCVAFSRAKKQLAVYGDADTLIQIPCFERLFDICSVQGGGCYREY